MNNLKDPILEPPSSPGSTAGAAPPAAATIKKTSENLPALDQQDQWRILLVDLIYNLNSSFRDVYYWAGVKTAKDTCGEMVGILHQLKEVPHNDRTVRISRRGAPGTMVSEKADYIIRLGDLAVDAKAISAVIKRLGIRLKHLEGRIIKSFEQFAAQEIDSLSIRIPAESEQALEAMRVSLQIVVGYHQAVENDTAINYDSNNENFSLQPIRNEFDQPDPNLTQLAALNNLSAEKVRQIVQKVSALMNRPDFSQAGIQPLDAYQTIFQIKSLRNKLRRPPIEMNSQKAQSVEAAFPAAPDGLHDSGPEQGFATADDVQTARPGPAPPAPRREAEHADTAMGSARKLGLGSADDSPAGQPDLVQRPDADADLHDSDPALRKTTLARYINDSYGNSIGAATQAMNTLYGQDYERLDLSGLENRLQQIVDLLNVMQRSEGDESIEAEIHSRIQTGLSQLPRENLDDLVVQDDLVKIWDGTAEKVLSAANGSLADIIDASQKRSVDRKQIRTILSQEKHIWSQDFEKLAEAFNMPPQETREIIRHYEDCFDSQNDFQRVLFEKKVSDFAAYPKRIFEILWEFLRETPRRKDRIPFLNSLQLLVSELGQPGQAIKILLANLLLQPEKISYSDRNALMLAILFLRTYNKEINMDIEITPEEVLQVQVGLEPGVVQYVVWKTKGEQKKFVQKMATIHQKLNAALEGDSSDVQLMPARFLMSLEREAYIFMALVGGETALAEIRVALDIYGDPASRIYGLRESRQYTTGFLQQLTILIRGLGRIGDASDITRLENIQHRQEAFWGLSQAPDHTAQVDGALSWIASAIREIKEREDEKLKNED